LIISEIKQYALYGYKTLNTTLNVTLEEFYDYYTDVSSSIDRDDYFELMMNNAWKINEGDRSYGKGWSNKDTSPSKTP